MTNNEEIIKEFKEEFKDKFWDEVLFEAEYGGGNTYQVTARGFIEDFLTSKLNQRDAEFKGLIKDMVDKKFPRGERKWGIECAKSIKKQLLTNRKNKGINL